MPDNNWDTYFMSICATVATNVKCPARQIGVVLVKDKHIISTGYNGPPSGFPNPGTPAFADTVMNLFPSGSLYKNGTWEYRTVPCPRKAMGCKSGEKLGYCPCAHAERNAISTAARMGHATEGSTLYLNSNIPCLDCAYSIVNAGIVEVVVEQLEEYPQEGFTGKIILEECGVAIRGVE